MSEIPSSWHPEVLPRGWTRAAADLEARSVLQDFYLAGGTGLAFHLGHRRSIDMDLFREAEFSGTNIRDRLRGLAGQQNLETSVGTLHMELHGIKISLLHYPYPLLFPTRKFQSIAVADPRHIACMKLDTIANRGRRRDFVDLYVAAQAFGIREIFAWFENKYSALSYNRTHLFKALTYFGDAERDPLPDMRVPLARLFHGFSSRRVGGAVRARRAPRGHRRRTSYCRTKVRCDGTSRSPTALDPARGTRRYAPGARNAP